MRILALLAVLVTTACEANFDVVVDVEEDGSGVVRVEALLDQETSAAILDLGLDSGGLPLRDLADADWTIVPPVVDESGRTTIEASKTFGTPGQFAEVIDELAGSDSVFQNFSLARQQSFGRVDYVVTGELDPTTGLAGFDDPGLQQTLGRTVESIVTSPPYSATPGDFNFRLTVVLPGELQEQAATGVLTTDGAMWDLNLGETDPVEVELRSTRRAQSAQVLRGVAVVALVLAALVAFAQLLRIPSSRRRTTPTARVRAQADARGRLRRPDLALSRVVEPEPGPEPEQPEAVVDEGPLYSVVALDGMGVLYKEGDDVRRLLVPFVRERGSVVPDEDIEAKARLLSLGRMTPADFWKAVGVAGDPNDLDSAYLSTHQLMPGVVRYLRSLRDQGVRVACITNDSVVWAMKLRAGHSLSALIDPWVVSGSVGVRKPDAPLFEVLRRVTGEAPSSILVVDDDLETLDAAREYGFGTAWFSADGDRADARGHDLLRGFEIGVEEDPAPVDGSLG